MREPEFSNVCVIPKWAQTSEVLAEGKSAHDGPAEDETLPVQSQCANPSVKTEVTAFIRPETRQGRTYYRVSSESGRMTKEYRCPIKALNAVTNFKKPRDGVLWHALLRVCTTEADALRELNASLSEYVACGHDIGFLADVDDDDMSARRIPDGNPQFEAPWSMSESDWSVFMQREEPFCAERRSRRLSPRS